MAKGKKYGDDVKERAYALLSVNNNIQAVADEMKLPYLTVYTWYQKWMKDGKNGKKDEENLKELRNKNKEKFVDNAWNIIANSMVVAQRRVERAVYYEQRIDAVADAILKHHESIERESGIAWGALIELVKELRGMKGLRLGELSSLMGVMYDKQALINKDPTSITETKRFEDFN